MKDLEETLHRIKDKEAIVSWIRNLPEDAMILVLVNVRKEDRDIHQYCCSDNLLITESNWMLDCYKYYLQTSTKL